ncbi:MAG: hypothetical protein O3C57_03895, partial [Verrucomicrobia bacterium]|nr:hypothetical protein [Verrucomicrobiota bacterium]
MGTLKGEGFWGGGNVVGKIRAAVSRTGTMDGPALHRIIQDREHPVIKARKHQIAINLLGICGGRPYVNARLSRFPGETKFEWEGGDRTDGSKVTGRRDRAPNVPHLRRIANKINEYNFSTPPIREGADPEIVSDITATGDGINRLMKTVNDYITACGWCWINVNAPAATGEGDPTLAEIQERKLRPYWQIYSPISVVDWCHDDTGSLLWLLTDTVSTDNSNPFAPLVAHRKRTLWQSASHAGQPTAMSTAFWYGKDGESIGPTRTEQAIRGMTELPWVMCGSASAEPNGFDDMESINKTILDLESCNDENFYKAMFPQRYIPISALENAREQFQVTAEEGINMIFGLGWPI